MPLPSASLLPTNPSASPRAVEHHLTLGTGQAGRTADTASAPWLIREVPLPQPSAVPSGAVDIDDLVAEFAATPKGAKSVIKGRNWVAKTFYRGHPSLSALRLQHGWSQAELARQVGTSQSYIGRLETGLVDPQLSTMRKIALALGVSVIALIEALTRETQS